MKKMIYMRIIGFLLAILYSTASFAYDIYSGGLYYNRLGTNKVSVTFASSNYNSYSGTITIPSSFTYNGTTYDVVEIGENAFYQCTGLTSLTIPNSVKVIRKYALYNCTKLSSITIPESVDTLLQSCMRSCTALKTVTFNGDSIWAHKNAFEGCTSIQVVNIKAINFLLHSYWYENESNPIYYAKCFYINGLKQTDVVIPEGITRIPANAFYGCESITSITFPSTLTSLGGFACCTGLTEVNIPDNVSEITNRAFYGCTGITSLVLPKKLEIIGNEAFSNLTNLTSLEFRNSQPFSAASYAFGYCYALKKITYASIEALCQSSFASSPMVYTTDCDLYIGDKIVTEIKIPYGIKSIGAGAFYKCRSLKSIKIPPTVETIGSSALYNCIALENLYLPKSVKYIGGGGLCNLTGLKYVNVPENLSSNSGWANATSWYLIDGCKGTIYIDKLADYRGDWRTGPWFVWGSFSRAIFSENISTIGAYSFYNNHLKRIDLSKNINSVDYNAFGSADTVVCNSLTPPSLNKSDFGGLNKTALVFVPAIAYETYKSDSIWGKFNNIFPITPGDEEINFKDYATRQICIDNFDFNHNGKLEQKEAARVTSLGKVFQGKDIGCFDELKYFTSITSIPSMCFANCKYLESVEFPSSVKSVNAFAFYGCTSLNEVYLNEGLMSIGSSAFHNCDHLKAITLPQSLILIDNSTFRGCISLDSIICNAVLPPTAKSDVFKDVNTVSCKLSVPQNSEESYQSTYPWSMFWASTAEEASKMHKNIEYDIDGDGIVNLTDILSCRDMVLRKIAPHKYADVDQNGIISIADVAAIVDKVVTGKGGRVITNTTITLLLKGSSVPSIIIPAELQSEITLMEIGDEYRIINNVVDTVLNIVIKGSCDKTLVYDGVKECNIHLNGVEIYSKTGSALDIQCGKKVHLIIEDGTTNRLADADNGNHNATLNCKGHLLVAGSGTLYITGNTAHAIKTKEYMCVSDANINILSSKKDAIHAGQYFKITSGSINIGSETEGDGIQVEKTTDPSDMYNGMAFIEGGKITITIDNQDNEGIQTDSTIIINGGDIEIYANGNGSRGIQTSCDMIIGEESTVTNIYIEANGEKCTLKECYNDPHRCMGIKVAGCLTVNGGNVEVINTGRKSRAIKVGNYVYNGGTVSGNITF